MRRVARGPASQRAFISLERPLTRRQVLQGGALLGSGLLVAACGSSTPTPKPQASALARATTAAAARISPSPTPAPVLSTDLLRSALGTLPSGDTFTLPGGRAAPLADLETASLALAAASNPYASVGVDPIATLGFILACADWSGRSGLVDLSGVFPTLDVPIVRLELPRLPGSELTDVLAQASPTGFVLRPGAALLAAGILPDGRYVLAIADPARTVAGHPRLELALLAPGTAGPLLEAAGASLSVSGTIALPGQAPVRLASVDPALAPSLVAAAGVLFVDRVPLQPLGAKTPALAADPVVPVPDTSVVSGAARVSQAKDGRVLALDAAGKSVGRAEYIGGTPAWDWQGADGLDWRLRELADRIGLRIGTAPGPPADSTYFAVVNREFNTENLAGPGWKDVLVSARGDLNLSYWDSRVARARAANMGMFGNLLFPYASDLPSWIDPRTISTSALRSAAEKLVSGVVAQLPEVHTWNVINEAVSAELYATGADRLFPDRFGSGFHAFIAQALASAHKANPSARLIINDTSNDGRDPEGTQRFLALTRELLDLGAPLDGVGMEMHLRYDESAYSGNVFTASRFADALGPYAELHVPVLVTEFDVDMTGFPGSKADEQRVQATFYRDALQTALSADVRDFYVFGLIDTTSWLVEGGEPNSDALMFDGTYRPKPSYYAVLDVLKQWAALPPA